MNLTGIWRYWPSLVAFVLIALGTVIWVNLDAGSAESADRIATVVMITRAEEGTAREDLLALVEIRDLEAAARPQGALSSLEEIPEGVLVTDHVPGQPVLASSVATTRVASLGPGYVAISIRLDPQRWVGPVLLTGRTVDVYDIAPEGPQRISENAVILESVAPNQLTPSQDTVLSVGVPAESLAAVLTAASENRIWLVGR